MFYHYEEFDYPENGPKDLLLEFESDEEVLKYLQEDIKHNIKYDVAYYLSEVTEPKIEIENHIISLSCNTVRVIQKNDNDDDE